MTTEFYILLKIKGSYNHTCKERWIYKKLKEPVVYERDSMIYQCKNSNYIESRGEYNSNSGFQHRDLFLTPYGEKRLNQLEDEYMKAHRKKILAYAKIVLELVAAVSGILACLLECW